MSREAKAIELNLRYRQLVDAKDQLYASLRKIRSLLPPTQAEQVVEKALIDTDFVYLLAPCTRLN